MVAADKKNKPVSPENAYDLPLPTPENASDPETYRALYMEIQAKAMSGQMDPALAKDLSKMVRETCEIASGVTLEEAFTARRDVVTQALALDTLLQATEDLLGKLEVAFRKIDGIDDAQKKRLVSAIERIVKVQRQAVGDPAKCQIYVDRNQDAAHAGQLLEPKWWTVCAFRTWMNPHFQHSLVMMPPGHGKSVGMTMLLAFEVGHQPELRCLWVHQNSQMAADALRALKRLIKLREYAALFPNVRILSCKEGEQDNSGHLVLARKNVTAKDYTVEVTGIGGNVNGRGFERVFGDDFCHPDVAKQQQRRESISTTWDTVIEQRIRDPKRARIRIVHTPWHPDDKVGQIRRQWANGQLPNWIVDVERYAIKKGTDGQWIPLWPEKWSPDFYAEQEMKLGPKFACLHQLKAATEQFRTIKRVHYYNSTEKFMEEADEALNEMLKHAEWYLSIDPAASGNQASSRQGVVRAALLASKYLLIEKVWFLQLSATDMFDWFTEEIADRCKAGTPYSAVVIEAQGGLAGQVNVYQSWAEERLPKLGLRPDQIPDMLAPGAAVGVQEVTQNRNKVRRVEAASPWISSGVVRFAGTRTPRTRNGEWGVLVPIEHTPMKRLTEGLVNLDGSNVMDAIDATTQIVLLLSEGNALADPTIQGSSVAASREAFQEAQRSKLSPIGKAMHEGWLKLAGQDDVAKGEDGMADMATVFDKYRVRRSVA